MNRLIGLHSSIPQSGKSTVAKILNEEHDYCTIPFAHPIKRLTETFLRQVVVTGDEIDLDFIEQNKTTLISELNPLMRQCNFSVRHLIQTLGTEWGRNQLHPDIWIMIWSSTVEKAGRLDIKVCSDDLRFANEALAIRNMGGEIWKIIRPDHSVDAAITNHPSEYGLDEKIFDRVIVNDGSIDDLKSKISQILAPQKVFF
jgi:hypothetical protein